MKILKWLIPIFVITSIFLLLKFIGKENINKILYSYAHPIRYEKIIEKYSQKYNVDEELVYAVIQNESKFYPYAKSKAGSKGLMQISDLTYEHAKKSIFIKDGDIYDKETNIEVGIWYLSHLIERFEDERYAVLAYNAGPENIIKWIDRGFLDTNKNYEDWNIPFIETRLYADKVFKSKEYYQKLLPNQK